VIVGVGIDVEDVDRFRRMRPEVRARVLARILTEREASYCAKFRDPWPHVAARFCVKEALVKALGARGPTRWREIELVPGPPPSIVLRGRTLEVALARGVKRIHVSLSHSRCSAVAVVVLESG